MYKKFRILKVDDIFTYQACGYGWRFFHKDLPKAIEDLMEISSERSLQIRTKKFNLTTLRKLSPIEFIVDSWNQIPIEVKTAGKLKQFKTQLRRHIISSY